MSYQALTTTGKKIVLTMCNSCGVLVGDTEVHDDFHKRLNNAIRLTQSAFDGAYPQGGGRY